MTITVHRVAVWEYLLAMGSTVAGEWDPVRGVGVVYFPAGAAAVRRALVECCHRFGPQPLGWF